MTASSPNRAEGDGHRGLHEAMASCRAATLALVADLDDDMLRAQPDPGFSPIGWHLGHVAYTEALWLAPEQRLRPEWERLFRQDGLPKAERRHLPLRGALLEYLSEARDCVFTTRLVAADRDPRLGCFILQHEAQHAETMAIVRRLAGFGTALPTAPADSRDLIDIPAGEILCGYDGVEALDNEYPIHRVELGAYRISQRPVSQRRFRAFMLAGGYDEPRFWSEEGWAWRLLNEVTRPRYWHTGDDDFPVHGVSAYEAEAYCGFIGARLPSEAEWERAALYAPEVLTLGEVWQWTETVFAPYEGFRPFPYPGYSSAYFDGRHRVLKGGSWVSQAPVLRPSFRNWYEPGTRQIFSGFRYVHDS